ncbi:MAG TPA: hypothetical protein VF841_12930 [Anaeromyxobacter sp.]
MPLAPLRDLPPRAGWRKGDVLVVLGELFGRGYANGVVDEARRAGMTIVGATVGRRDAGGALRPLSADELAGAEAALGGRIVNVPLEAGFDLEPAGDGGPTPVDQLKAVKASSWESFRLDWDLVERSREAGARRFERSAAAFAAEVERLVPPGANVLLVHTMAGGFPRARALMPLMTRVFRGTGDKLVSSAAFWASDLGRLWAAGFDEVTARTFGRLVAATAGLRAGARRVRYAAFGYHGCEVLVGGRYTWQTYVPYLQGWAKLLLERLSEEAWREGVRCAVFDAPEIWTNSSALFLGVEVSLYPLLEALRREGPGSAEADAVWAACRALLRDGATLEAHLERAERYLASPAAAPFRDLEAWPQHAAPDQMEAMLAASDDLLAMSADPRNPVCAELSRAVARSVGRLMFDAAWEPPGPVRWLGHDVVARRLVDGA